MKILFLFPYPLHQTPSQRFRFEQYFLRLSKNGIAFSCQSFWSNKVWNILYIRGFYLTKILGFIAGFVRRWFALFRAASADFIFIHRECTPIGPPFIEWFIARVLHKKIIYDFDDAIWLTDLKTETSLISLLKWRKKVKSICQWSYKVSCGNEYLCNYARQFNNHVIYNPTTIDTNGLHNPLLYTKQSSADNVIVGWTGSHSTLKYLNEIESTLIAIQQKFPFVTFRVIADQPPMLNLQSLVFKPWSLATEIEDLYQFDIGIMPLPDDEWANGKCGFKALQYMALEIPTVASPVGVNSHIIDHGVNGFLATSANEWLNHVEKLIANKQLRLSLGQEGRKKVIQNYSVSSNSENFLLLFA